MPPGIDASLAGQPRHQVRWQWCLAVLVLALVVRLAWLWTPFNYDAAMITTFMRAMAHGGISEIVTTVQDRIHLPLTLYLLLLPGWFSQGASAGSAPTLIEMFALRLALIFTDLLMVAAVYRMGRTSATPKVALLGAVLCALWPADIYVNSWWAQTDIWYLVGLMLAAWWLARQRVALAWLALALAMAAKWQAILVLPVFAVGTWRWCGWRGLVKGGLVAGGVWAVVAAPVLVNGRGIEFLVKSLYQVMPPYIVQKAQNFWFAVVPMARAMENRSLDLNPWLGGASFRDISLALVALFQAIIAGRLFWRSGPRAIAAAAGLAVLATTMFSTQISTRHYLAAPALFLVAGFFDRKWWAIFGLLGVTQFINLVWESGSVSPLWGLMPVSMDLAVLTAWANLAILALALGIFLQPLWGRPARQAHIEEPFKTPPQGMPFLLALTGLGLLAGMAAYLWGGRTLGAPILGQRAPLMASLHEALGGVGSDEHLLVTNWPWLIAADRPLLAGVLPVTPPALIFDWPYAPAANVRLVQVAQWQGSAPGTQVQFGNDRLEPGQVGNLLADLKVDRIVDFHAASNQMYLLAERLPAAAAPVCRAQFGPGLCLVEARAVEQGGELRLDLTWQTSETLEPDLGVWLSITDPQGGKLAQANANPVRDALSLSSWRPQNGALHEVRWLQPAADRYQVWMGVYHKETGQRLSVVCAPSALCGNEGLLVFGERP